MEVLSCVQLGCGMSFKTKHSLVGRHSASVVDDLYQGPSCVLYPDCNLIGTCIHCILDQFLHHGCRSLHDLARSDHISDVAW